jgi:MFS family permease
LSAAPGDTLERLVNDAALPSASADASPRAQARRGEAGLDWFAFCLADIQAGFGPFVAAYLTTHSWTQLDIGLVLTTGGLIALAGQIPGGALVDSVRSARTLAAGAVLAICASALALAFWPTVFEVVIGSRAVHAAASCILGPALMAMSLGTVGHSRFGERVGRNARFASIGTGVGVAAMGACGYLFTNQSVFIVTAMLALPALLALSYIGPARAAAERAGDTAVDPARKGAAGNWLSLLTDRRLIIFAGCIVLFQLANAAMLPITASVLTMREPAAAPAVIAICMFVPQLVVAACAPWVGRRVEVTGRRFALLVCFAAVAVRGLLFAAADGAVAVVLIQVLDGVSAAIMGVTFPLIIADLTRGTGRFNSALGIVGSAVGVGAALSTVMAGFLLDRFGGAATFVTLAAVAAMGLAAVYALLPETRPAR